MKIMGVDPGSRKLGVGVIETQANRYVFLHTETILVPQKQNLPKKLNHIYHSLRALLLDFSPDVLSIENIFYHKDVRATVRIGEVRACAMLASSEMGIDVVEYAPARIKQSVTGNGRATKEQVGQMVKVLLNLNEIPPEDSADALAVAICHGHHQSHLKYVSVSNR